MVETATVTGAVHETGAPGTDYGTGATIAQYRRQRAVPRDVPADAVERLRARMDKLTSSWTPSFQVDDVEDIFREA